MEFIPRVLRLNQIWIYLPYEDIVTLCQLDRKFNTICQNNETWIYLLRRDFWIDYPKPNAREIYLQYRQTLKHFSRDYPIITQRALNLIVNHIPSTLWKFLDESTTMNEDESILSISMVIDLMVNSGQSWEPLQNVGDSRLIYPDFDQMLYQLNSNCQNFEVLTNKSSLIHVNMIPTIINYDYDLAFDLWTETPSGCDSKFEELEDQMLKLLSPDDEQMSMI